MAAIQAAQDVDHLGLIPPWTPTNSELPGSAFSSVSQPWYYVMTFDTATGQFVVDDEQYNVINELTGTIDYPQPAS